MENKYEKMLEDSMKDVVRYYKPNFDEIVAGRYQGIVSKEYGGLVKEYYKIETDNGVVLVPTYGYLKKHMQGIKIDDDIVIKLVAQGVNRVTGNKGYIFAVKFQSHDETAPF